MSKYIDADLLCKEIERRKKENMYVDLPMSIGRYYEDRDILAFLDTIPEQPVEGLEKEISTWIPAHISCGDDEALKDAKNAVIEWAGIIARHFAEWGEKNAYKAIMKKADEVRDKRFDTDYEVKIEPAAGFDLGCVNVYRGGKLVGQYVEPKEEKKLPEDLEEGYWLRTLSDEALMKELKVRHHPLFNSASDLVDAVERYVNPQKGQFCHRSELLILKDKLKNLINN